MSYLDVIGNTLDDSSVAEFEVSAESLELFSEQEWMELDSSFEDFEVNIPAVSAISRIVNVVSSMESVSETEGALYFAEVNSNLAHFDISTEDLGIDVTNFQGTPSLEGLVDWIAKVWRKAGDGIKRAATSISNFKRSHLTILGTRVKFTRGALSKAMSAEGSPLKSEINIGVAAGNIVVDSVVPKNTKELLAAMATLEAQMDYLYGDWLPDFEKKLDEIRKVYRKTKILEVVSGIDDAIEVLRTFDFKEPIKKMGVGKNFVRGDNISTSKTIMGNMAVVANNRTFATGVKLTSMEYGKRLEILESALQMTLELKDVPFAGRRPIDSVFKAPNKEEIIQIAEANARLVEKALAYFKRTTNRGFSRQLLKDVGDYAAANFKLSYGSAMNINGLDFRQNDFQRMIDASYRLGAKSMRWYYNPGNKYIKQVGKVSSSISDIIKKSIRNLE